MKDDEIINNTDEGECGHAVPTITKAKLRKRKRAAKLSKTVFKAIDVIFGPPQNACPYINDDNVGSIDCETDVVYDSANSNVCTADVYRVKSEEKQPAVILIHGGGFSAGDKKCRMGLSRYFAVNGFTVFCVNYGLSPEYKFPEPILHLVSAANFVYDNAERFNVDRDRIIVAGDSAGAYYASILATISTNNDYAAAYDRKIKFKISGAILNCGVYNLDAFLEAKNALNIDEGILVNFAGIGKEDFDSYKYRDFCMPFDYITRAFPPTFLIYAPGDFFCKNQGEIMKSKLEEQGVYFECYAARHNSSIHCFSLNWRGEDAFAANELLMSFAKRLASDKIKF
ncbi:MAG: alpha/beta hydrolase [Clostridiales bacterium]|nr:alpha/beta hydrolase [Clostridiales bacterium]